MAGTNIDMKFTYTSLSCGCSGYIEFSPVLFPAGWVRYSATCFTSYLCSMWNCYITVEFVKPIFEYFPTSVLMEKSELDCEVCT